MRKILINLFIVCCFLLTIGCEFSPVYTVPIDGEGIVTQNGEVISGPKRPGLHFKVPIIQKVYMVNVLAVRISPVPLQRNKSLKVKVLWHVTDSMKYFKLTEPTEDDSKTKSIILPAFSNVIDTFVSEYLLENGENRSKNIEIPVSEYEHIVRSLQEATIEYGIKIVTIEISNK